VGGGGCFEREMVKRRLSRFEVLIVVRLQSKLLEVVRRKGKAFEPNGKVNPR